MENKELNDAEKLDKAMENYHFDVIEEFKKTGLAMFVQDIDGIQYGCKLISENTVLLTNVKKDPYTYVGCGELINYKCVNQEFFSKPISMNDLNSAKTIARELLK